MASPTPDVTESSDCPSYHDVIVYSDPFGQLEIIDNNTPAKFESETTFARNDSGEIVDGKRSGDIHPRSSHSAVTSNPNGRPPPELTKRKGNDSDGVVNPLDTLQSLNSKAESFVRRQREEEVPLEPFGGVSSQRRSRFERATRSLATFVC